MPLQLSTWIGPKERPDALSTPMRTEQPMRRPNVAPGDPAWEAMKAARRGLSHDEAVQEIAFLQRQYRLQWSNRVPPSPVDLNVVLRTLIQKRIPFVLTGAHGIGGWTGRPRNTQDVDILVKPGRNHGLRGEGYPRSLPGVGSADVHRPHGFLRPRGDGFGHRCRLPVPSGPGGNFGRPGVDGEPNTASVFECHPWKPLWRTSMGPC